MGNENERLNAVGIAQNAVSIENAVKERINTFDMTYSRFREDSLVAHIRERAGEYLFPEDTRMLFSLYKELYFLTKGKITPLIGSVLVDAGYDPEYSLTPQAHIASAPSWEEVMEYTHPVLTTKVPISLDFGALGKGYIVDIVAEILENKGVLCYTINAGGDIKTTTLLHVGLEDPRDTSKAVGVVKITSGSICGSSGNRRAWKGFTHIIDPQSVVSPTHIHALWVVADTTLLADALTTALYFVDPEVLLKNYHFEYAIIYADNSIRHSEAFPGTFFT